jgi:hypothetical protein
VREQAKRLAARAEAIFAKVRSSRDERAKLESGLSKGDASGRL